MRRLIGAFLSLCLLAAPARAGPTEEAQRIYDAFVVAQNSHDVDLVRTLLLDGPDFLWVTNGLTIWGADAAIARMRRFQANEVWRIEPDRDRLRTVAIASAAAMLHVPLSLIVGRTEAPDRYFILVSALCVETPGGWRIAALLTTDENRSEARP